MRYWYFCLQMDNDRAGSVDVKSISILMNVTEPLETLRKLLELQLQCSLETVEFWLQDTMKVCHLVVVLLLYCALY